MSITIMRNPFLKILITVSVSLLLLTISCTPEACFEETNAYLKGSFYLYSTGNLVAPDSITVFGIGKESSKIYNKSSLVKQSLLPLNASTGNCGFIMKINGVTDTLSAWYTSYPHLLSQQCGYTYYHTLDSVSYTKNIIDTVRVILKSVTTVNGENIRIYY